MTVLNRITAPWAVHPDTYDVLWSVFQRWERGEPAPSFEPQWVRVGVVAGSRDKNDPYEAVVDEHGIGFVPIAGTFGQKNESDAQYQRGHEHGAT